MKYQKFHIENFKGINKLDLDLNKHPNSKIFTLVGLNESGKTTVLEALDFFKNDEEPEKSYKFIPKSKKSNFNGSIKVQADFILEDDDIKTIKEYAEEELNFEIETLSKEFSVTKRYGFESSKYKDQGNTWSIDIKGYRLTEETKEDGETETVKSELVDTGKDDTEWQSLVKKIRELIPEIIYYPNFLFDFPSKIYLEAQPSEHEQQLFYRAILQDILDSLDDDLDLKEHILDRVKNANDESKEALDALLDKMGSIVTRIIFKAWETMFSKKIQKEIVFKVGGEPAKSYVEVKLKENSTTYNIDERSLGFKWFFTFLLFTEFRKNRVDDPGETIFLLDEPAYNLHSTAQTKLLGTFEKLTDSCLLIYTTHSHHLIEPKWLPATFIIKNEALDYESEEDYNSTKTDIKAIQYRTFLGSHPTEKDYFQPILDKIEYQPSLLEQVPNIIVTEGKYDYYTFRYINETILGNKYSLNLYPGAGVDKLEDIFRLYLAWGKPFKGLFDSDPAGLRAKNRYVKEISQELKDLIFTLEDIDDSWVKFTTESLFSEQDKKLILEEVFDDPSYTKNKFNNAIQELFIGNTEVKLSQETKSKFEKIFKSLIKEAS